MPDSRPEFKKIILIGLGGAGKLILTHLKRLFMDAYNVVPPSIKFLSLDTDLAPIALRSALSEKQYSLDEGEFLHMKVTQPITYIKNSCVQEWFIEPLPAGSIHKGAGAIRQIGRLAFFYHIPEFQRRVDNMLTELNSTRLATVMGNAKVEMNAVTDFKLFNGAAEVYVCGSLAGGTGSGTFLDVGIFLRDQISDALIHGFFLLNWIYRNKAWAYRVQGNVYAALSELDNIQSITFGPKEFMPYSITYAQNEVKVEKPPYSLVHLVDGRNEFGENVHEVAELCETAANAIFLSVGAMGDPIASAVDNLLSHINVGQPKLWNGKYARYSSFGVASLYYPAKELHRLIALSNANALCAAAVEEVMRAGSDQTAASQKSRDIQQDVEHLLGENKLNLLNRSFVRDKVCPFQSTITFQIAPFMIADKTFPQMIEFNFDTEKTNLEKQLKDSWDQNAETFFIRDTLMGLNLKLDAMEKDPKIGPSHIQDWLGTAISLLSQQQEQATRDVNRSIDDTKNTGEEAKNIKEMAVKSRYVPFLGGARKTTTATWAEAIAKHLDSLKNQRRLENEKRFYDRILEVLGAKKADPSKSPNQLHGLLQGALQGLRTAYNQEVENLKILKSKSNQVLIGNGNIVVYHAEDKKHGISLAETIDLPYDDFKRETSINTLDDFQNLAAKGSRALYTFFLDYCQKKLDHLKEVTIEEAMDTIGAKNGNRDEYVKENLDHLFRLSSALWNFNKGRLNEVRQLQYDKVVNLGVYSQEQGRKAYNDFVEDVKVKYGIRPDHAFSTTGDRHRIWLLNYAAALPAYFSGDLEKNKKRYENEITPTYHIDKRFEMDLPDLFPTSDIANRALRILGMAIVPGIDVIHDEKLTKGHEFTLSDPESTKNNLDQPKTWRLFRDMYDDVIDHYNPQEKDNLLNILERLLRQKVVSMQKDDRDGLIRLIREYMANVNKKLQVRTGPTAITRLISARLTYREIRELEKFLQTKATGYAMNIDDYIEGRL